MEKSAEHFLSLIQRSKRGRFKIYIGMAAGVGKTYRMLQDAQQLLKNGVDVQIGYVETHNRAETVRMLEGLPVIPRKKLFYKGHELEEMDIDTVLQIRPQIVVVDELAHTNITGSKNEKRWQDVNEILDSGISVIAAMNIQHIESLNHIVERFAGKEVTERVPDSILQQADEVVNIDLTVDELQQRLKEGKIYALEKVPTALNNFFKQDNLLQLRELALREVANQVERKIDKDYSVKEHKSNDRILCCISTNDKGAKKVIRKTARIASRFDADWYIIYVQKKRENPDKINLAVQRHLINNFQMAMELGATVHKVKGNSIADEICRFINEKHITLLVMGNSNEGKFKRMFSLDLISKLENQLDESGVDILLVN
ncbi:MAG: sensor protein KdpD [Sphingobacteriales bacterium]|nr:MAG: sensor protein KdpD [Sphingobacteriales bacterium]